MAVQFSKNLTVRDHLWTNWKSVYNSHKFIYQYEDDGVTYFIWGYDGPEVHTAIIYKGTVPDGIIINYTQSQNDTDKTDFETNYKSAANSALVKLTETGVAGQAPSKGLGGFVPDPNNNTYQPGPDEVTGHYVDVYGALVTRGQTFTDEGSLRDDFTGTALETTLTGTATFTNGSNIVIGTGTIFTQELDRTYYIKLSADGYDKYVAVQRIPDDANLYLTDNYNGSSATGAVTATRWLWIPQGSTPGTISVGSSVLTLSSGTNNGGAINTYRDGDYLPIISTWVVSISQRINNQTSFIGFRDDVTNPTMFCDVFFTGTDNTFVEFRSAWNGDIQTSTVMLPAGLDTSQSLRYKIDLNTDYCALFVNGVRIATHENHIPDPYASQYLCVGISNSATVTNTDIVVDNVFFNDQDQVQITSSFTAPLSVISREDQHTLYGTLTTTATTSDQVIVSYTVPAGKVFYMVGYRVQTSGSLSGTPVKIGKNSVTTITSSPGSVDGNVFRSFNLAAGGDTGDIDFSTPRKLGVGGDVVKITVTPSGLLAAAWYAALDFVLR